MYTYASRFQIFDFSIYTIKHFNIFIVEIKNFFKFGQNICVFKLIFFLIL
jgi:hypothetical protein